MAQNSLDSSTEPRGRLRPPITYWK